jgi:hypothetical protein
MTLADMGTADLIGTLLAFAFTLMVFSYILGDNPLFRLAIHIFIGVAAGYTTVIAWYNVIWPQLLLPLITGGTAGRFILLIPLVLGALLFSKLSPRLAGLGSLALASWGPCSPKSAPVPTCLEFRSFLGGQVFCHV